MNLFELVALVVENLGRRKARVALTAIGVIIGTAAIIVLVSLGIGMQRAATAQLLNLSELKLVRVDPGFLEFGGPGGGPSMIPISGQSLADMAAIPGVERVVPRDYMMGGAMLRYNRLEGWGNFIGVGGVSDLSELGYTAQAGSLVLEKGSAVIGVNVSQSFYDPRLRPGQEPPPPPDLMGQSLKIILMKWDQEGNEIRKTVSVRIAGVIAETRSEPDYTIYLGLNELTVWNEWFSGRRINRDRDGYNSVILLATDATQTASIADQVIAMGFNAYTPQQTAQGVSNFFVVIQIIFGGVGAISLLVAAIGIANTMAMAILERTREIGLMKAVGATNRDVLSIFLGEAAGIGFLGGLGGLVAGWSIGKIINVLALVYLAGQIEQPGMAMTSINVYTPPWLMVFALLFATLIGLLSGVYPALRAATLVPVLALKYE